VKFGTKIHKYIISLPINSPHRKTPACYKMLHRASELVGSYEHGNETSGSIKGGKFLD
jgi:hypothetical protein